MGRLVEAGGTRLYVEERGDATAFALLVFHGGPGLDHAEFGDHLDPLADGGRYRLLLADRGGPPFPRPDHHRAPR